MNILKYLKCIDIITFFNVISGILAMIYSIKGELYVAVIFLFIAVIMDAIDGKVSRRFEKSSDFGKELDSLADVISFGVAPIIFINSILERNVLNIFAYSFFLISCVLRLARFNITKKPYFEGMPITLNGIIIPVLFLINTPLFLYPYILILLGIFMISDVRIKRLDVGK